MKIPLLEYKPAINPKQGTLACTANAKTVMSGNLSWKEKIANRSSTSKFKKSSPLHYIFEQWAAGSFLLLKISHKVLLKSRDLKNAFAEASYFNLLHLT